jgi:hypothetical protein
MNQTSMAFALALLLFSCAKPEPTPGETLAAMLTVPLDTPAGDVVKMQWLSQPKMIQARDGWSSTDSSAIGHECYMAAAVLGFNH